MLASALSDWPAEPDPLCVTSPGVNCAPGMFSLFECRNMNTSIRHKITLPGFFYKHSHRPTRDDCCPSRGHHWTVDHYRELYLAPTFRPSGLSKLAGVLPKFEFHGCRLPVVDWSETVRVSRIQGELESCERDRCQSLRDPSTTQNRPDRCHYRPTRYHTAVFPSFYIMEETFLTGSASPS